MVQLNIVNFVTIGVITILAVMLVRFVTKAMGKESPV